MTVCTVVWYIAEFNVYWTDHIKIECDFKSQNNTSGLWLTPFNHKLRYFYTVGRISIRPLTTDIENAVGLYLKKNMKIRTEHILKINSELCSREREREREREWSATLVSEFAVEDLPVARTAALVPEFAVNDLLLGRTLMMTLSLLLF